MNVEPIIRKKKDKKRATHLTMMVIPNSHGAAIKKFCLPMWLFKSFMILSITCILVVTYFTSGYFLLKYVAKENEELKAVNIAQAEEISELKGLAGSMREKLEYLVELDQQVRKKVGLTISSSEKDTKDADKNMQSSRAFGPYGLLALDIDNNWKEPLITKLFPSLDGQASVVLAASNVDLSGLQLQEENEIDTLDELKEQLAQMDTLMTEQAETMNKLISDVDKQLAYLNALPDAWPLQGRITSWYGWRTNPYNSRSKEFHEGIDIASSYGSAIRAAGDGVVTFAGYKGSWGRMILISHGYGYVSQYTHNSSLLVKNGDKVKKGDVIARLGNTGRSTGPHLHFGVAKNGKWINPMDLLNKARTNS